MCSRRESFGDNKRHRQKCDAMGSRIILRGLAAALHWKANVRDHALEIDGCGVRMVQSRVEGTLERHGNLDLQAGQQGQQSGLFREPQSVRASVFCAVQSVPVR